ncbi:MAG: class I SAM-dependent methyltransferase [Bacteroidota bacterium]|nr:class I SAM-dependent methyltransferase [Bacteroidota bacterium]
MERILEPEVMDTLEDVLEYDTMDFTEVNTLFAQRAIKLLPMKGVVLDVGTGTARIPLLMLEINPNLNIVTVDLSENMLEVARLNVKKAHLSKKITLQKIDAKKLPFEDNYFDAVVSNSLLHHISDPIPVFKEINRVTKKWGSIFIRDLIRPDSEEAVNVLVNLYAGDADEYQKKLYRDSLYASFTLEEVESLIVESGIKDTTIVQSSDRHWSIERKWS